MEREFNKLAGAVIAACMVVMIIALLSADWTGYLVDLLWLEALAW